MKYLHKQTVIITTLLMTGVSTAWAECPEGKSEVLLTTPSGKEQIQCVSDNALPGVTNKTLNLDVEASCPCWDAESLDNLPDLGPQQEPYPNCYDIFGHTGFRGYDQVSQWTSQIAISDYPDFYAQPRYCIIYTGSDNSSWPGMEVRTDDISHPEAYACAKELRASKWWAMCSDVEH